MLRGVRNTLRMGNLPLGTLDDVGGLGGVEGDSAGIMERDGSKGNEGRGVGRTSLKRLGSWRFVRRGLPMGS